MGPPISIPINTKAKSSLRSTLSTVNTHSSLITVKAQILKSFTELDLTMSTKQLYSNTWTYTFSISNCKMAYSNYPKNSTYHIHHSELNCQRNHLSSLRALVQSQQKSGTWGSRYHSIFANFQTKKTYVRRHHWTFWGLWAVSSLRESQRIRAAGHRRTMHGSTRKGKLLTNEILQISSTFLQRRCIQTSHQ